MDEIKNRDLCNLLLVKFGIPQSKASEWIEYTQDRPFNDMRYAVDAAKISALGWKQNTSFEDGLELTVNWYKQFGETWWGDISQCLTAFPSKKQN